MLNVFVDTLQEAIADPAVYEIIGKQQLADLF
jgi:hypothetical protein